MKERWQKVYSFANIAGQMSKRAIIQRYRGSLLGIAWAFLTPLFMLIVYTFIFTKVFTVRWGQAIGDGTVGELGVFEFAIVLFSGLTLYSFLSEVTLGASNAITNNVNYVKKIVFPLHILPLVTVISALFQLLISLIVLMIFQLAVSGHIPWTALLSPIALIPLIIMMTGLSWWLSSLGAYLRDMDQILAPLVTALLFIAPILYPMDSFNEDMHIWINLNPLTIPIVAFRDLVFWGSIPNFLNLTIYTIIALIISITGYGWFNHTRKGFADVL